MGAKGRKKLQRKKARHRTGLIESLTGPYSLNQHNKRAEERKRRDQISEAARRYFGL